MDLTPVLYGIAAVLVLVLMIAVGPVVWKMMVGNSSSKSSPPTATTASSPTTAPATSSATATATTTVTTKRNWLNWKTVAGAVVLVLLLAYFWEKVPSMVVGVLGAMLMLVVGILLTMKGGSVGKWLGIPLIILAAVFGRHSPQVLTTGQDKAASVVLDGKPLFETTKTERKVAATTVTSRIVPVDITLKPGETTVVEMARRCHADNVTAEQMRKVTRVQKGTQLHFTSALDTEITRRVWFFDEGGFCKEDFNKLLQAKAFI